MRLLFSLNHPDTPAPPKLLLKRRAARAIILRDDQALLLYTRRYDDYSLPGGGVADGEDLHEALSREVVEETGASDLQILSEFGEVQESRPHWGDYDAMAMQSFVYVCTVADQLGAPRMESYELANGMQPQWVRVCDAIAHNTEVMRRRDARAGFSIDRETRLLQRVLHELIS